MQSLCSSKELIFSFSIHTHTHTLPLKYVIQYLQATLAEIKHPQDFFWLFASNPLLSVKSHTSTPTQAVLM